MSRALSCRRVVVAASLFAAVLTTASASAATFYVATNGNNSNAGTSSAPFLTIQKGVDVAQAGDTVLVRGGTYNQAVTFVRSGTSSAYITLKSETKHGAKIVASYDHAIGTDGKNYLNVVDFDVRNNFPQNYNGSGILVRNAHHVGVYGNRVHDCSGGGIATQRSDSTIIEYNETFNNTIRNKYQTSGISVFQPIRMTGNADYCIKIRYNRSHNNTHTVKTDAGAITDGNGIIIDNTRGIDQGAGIPGSGQSYDRWILVEHNFCWKNGGAGVATFEATKTLIRNNSTYANFQIAATGQAEIVVGNSDSVRVINNAMHGKGNAFCTKTYGGTNLEWSHNALHNGGNQNAVLWSTLYANPQFVDTSTGNLHLSSGSPCVGAGTTGWGTGPKDIDNQGVPIGTIDIGADER